MHLNSMSVRPENGSRVIAQTWNIKASLPAHACYACRRAAYPHIRLPRADRPAGSGACARARVPAPASIEVFSAYLPKNDRRPTAKPVAQSWTRPYFHPLARRLIDTICATSYFRFFQFFSFSFRFVFFLFFVAARPDDVFSLPRRRVINKGIRAILRINERRAAALHYPL